MLSNRVSLQDITRDCQIGIRPYAEALLQGAEQALRLDDLKDSEKVQCALFTFYNTAYYEP